MNALSPTASFLLFSYDDSPQSVHTTSLLMPKSSFSFRSRGFSVTCSLVFPGLMQNASGIPSMSVNSPICTIGLGLCSFECPYCRSPLSSSLSK